MSKIQDSTHNIEEVAQPQPMHHRTPSYSDKFIHHKSQSDDSEMTPPEPVKTPSIEEDNFMKPFLPRSNTSHYQSDLEHSTGWGKGRPSLRNAISSNDAYHTQQRRKIEGKDINGSDSVEDLNTSGEFGGNYHYGDQHLNKTENEDTKSEDDPDIEMVNDVSQLKRRLSWWSNS